MHREGGVAETVAEGEERRELLLVDVAIAHVETFVIIDVPEVYGAVLTLDAWIATRIGHTLTALLEDGSVNGALVERSIPRHGQVARRIDVTDENLSKRGACLRAKIPVLQDSRNTVDPWHGYGIARDVDHHETRIGLSQGLDELVLSVRKGIVGTVGAFVVLSTRLVETTDEDDHISLASHLNGFGAEFFGTTRIVKVLTCRYTIVGTAWITHVTTCIADLNTRAGKTCLEAIEGHDLVLCLEAAGTATHGHHLDGVLANDEEAANLRQVQGEQGF